MGSQVYRNEGELSQEDFLVDFINQEFSNNLITSVVSQSSNPVKNKRKLKKETLTEELIKRINSSDISEELILEYYVKAPRMWLSFKTGEVKKFPKLKDPQKLLHEFGEEGWYGPIIDSSNGKRYYIFIKILTDKFISKATEEGKEGDEIKKHTYRWSVIAEVEPSYIALSWWGFSLFENNEKQSTQFPFWKYIPTIFSDFEKKLEADLAHPELYNLVLNQLWGKYIEDELYKDLYDWSHLKIKANSYGVALNAKTSAKSKEFELAGLQALSKHLAKTAMNVLSHENDPSILSQVEGELLKTLMKDWGTTSYEFSLDELIEDRSKKEKIFKAFCHFGLGKEDIDSLQHLKCYAQYGNSTGALNFLLKELEIR